MAVSSVSARRAANRLILYRYGVGSRENGEVGASADQIEGRKTGSSMDSSAEGGDVCSSAS